MLAHVPQLDSTHAAQVMADRIISLFHSRGNQSNQDDENQISGGSDNEAPVEKTDNSSGDSTADLETDAQVSEPKESQTSEDQSESL